MSSATALRANPEVDAEELMELGADTPFLMLDDSLGWAWGYAGEARRVGYVPTAALASQ